MSKYSLLLNLKPRDKEKLLAIADYMECSKSDQVRHALRFLFDAIKRRKDGKDVK